MTRRVRAWLPAAAWAALIFLVSAQPTIPADLSGGLDKVAHLAAYSVLGALLAHATGSVGPAVALGWIYAASDEVHQRFVPGRSYEIADWMADAIGVLLGALFFHWWRRRSARDARPGGAMADPSAP